MKKIKIILLCLSVVFSLSASIERCRLDSIIGAIRTLQNESSKNLGKTCTILEKVCELQTSSFSFIGTATSLEEILQRVNVVQNTDSQILEKVCDILNTDTQILEKVCNLQLTISGLPCAPTPIFSAQTISVPGVYCLANSVVGQMTIASSDVDLDLNRHRISGGTNGVVINSGLTRIVIRNGVTGPVTEDGIRVNANSSNVMIEDIKTINCGITGINLDQVNNSSIENCDLTSNVTGLTLDRSYKITVDSCKAKCNRLAGFSLLLSNTNCFTKCKALSTGQGATGDSTDIFGFKSFSGFGNIFEHCIVNSTQALTTTDANSLVAGFALTGNERCSKIIKSESANTTVSPTGQTVPTGILLESTFDMLTSLTTAGHGAAFNSVHWRPDGLFLAAGGSSGFAGIEGRVYRYNRKMNRLTQVATITDASNSINGVRWSPDGRYLAVVISGNVQNVRIYEFDSSNGTLTLRGITAHGASVNTVDWSPDGKFIVIGGELSAFVTTRIYKFDRTTNTLTEFANATGSTVNSVRWSNNQRFIGYGTDINGASIFIKEFDETTPSLINVFSTNHGASVNAVDWTPDAKFFLIGGIRTSNITNRIYLFDADSPGSTTEVSVFDRGADVNGVNWSSDGKFFVLVSPFLVSGQVDVVDFNRNNNIMTLLDTAAYDQSAPATSVSWSSDGGIIAVVGQQGVPTSLELYTGLTFPTKNVIKDNIVYCNEGNECPGGIGINGSSIENLIVNNTAYENPMNYVFVTNVFTGGLNGTDGTLQNVSVPPL